MEWMSTAEAAEELEVSAQQVTRLARSGVLAAQRFGPTWLVSADAVRSRRRAERRSGRPMSPEVAWQILNIVQAAIDAGGHGSAADLTVAGVSEALGKIGDRKLRYRLRGLLGSSPPAAWWPQWLRHRADLRTVWVHPGLLERLLLDARVRTDRSEAARLVGSPTIYVEASDEEGILDEYHARLELDGPVRLQVIPSSVPRELLPGPGASLPSAVVMLDAIEAPDARPRWLALEVLEEARAALTALARL